MQGVRLDNDRFSPLAFWQTSLSSEGRLRQARMLQISPASETYYSCDLIDLIAANRTIVQEDDLRGSTSRRGRFSLTRLSA
jgi:hypothetical protein